MELNIWMSSTLTDIPTYSSSDRKWSVTISRNGALRALHPKHVIMATGHSGEPNIPVFPGAADFKGDRLCHSSQFSGAKPDSQGLKAIVIGCCNSAHDIAQDYYERGAEVTMVQRSSTYVMTSENGLGVLLRGFYEEDGVGLPKILIKTGLIFSWGLASARRCRLDLPRYYFSSAEKIASRFSQRDREA